VKVENPTTRKTHEAHISHAVAATAVTMSSLLTAVLSFTAPVRKPYPLVWDGVLSPDTLGVLITAGEQRGHVFTSVFDRGESVDKPGRTVIEVALCSILEQMGDESRYLEYWWRGDSKGMEVHRDVDEALCRSHRVGDIGVQRCPSHGHVLYLDIESGVRGPTCVWEEEPDHSDNAAILAAGARRDPRSGPPRSLSTLHVVPAVAGRLLRFDGASLHSVLGPKCALLETSGTAPIPPGAGVRRAVLLFNTWWCDPPGLPSPQDPAAPKAVAALAALPMRPSCEPGSAWRAVVPTVEEEKEEEASTTTLIKAALLGDLTRRGCEAASLTARVGTRAIEAALASEAAVHSVRLLSTHAKRGDGEAGPLAAALGGDGLGNLGMDLGGFGGVSGDSSGGTVEIDEEEELAMRLGHAAHLESEFWGVDDAEDDFELDDDNEEGEQGSPTDLSWANFVAARKELETGGDAA
jgi:hypothetical protein